MEKNHHDKAIRIINILDDSSDQEFWQLALLHLLISIEESLFKIAHKT